MTKLCLLCNNSKINSKGTIHLLKCQVSRCEGLIICSLTHWRLNCDLSVFLFPVTLLPLQDSCSCRFQDFAVVSSDMSCIMMKIVSKSDIYLHYFPIQKFNSRFRQNTSGFSYKVNISSSEKQSVFIPKNSTNMLHCKMRSSVTLHQILHNIMLGILKWQYAFSIRSVASSKGKMKVKKWDRVLWRELFVTLH